VFLGERQAQEKLQTLEILGLLKESGLQLLAIFLQWHKGISE